MRDESSIMLFLGIILGLLIGGCGSCFIVDKQATRVTLDKAIPCTSTNQGQVVRISGYESWICSGTYWHKL